MASEGRQIDGDILQGKADVLRARQEGLGAEEGDEAVGQPAMDAAPVSATDASPVSGTAETPGKPLPAALRPLGAPIPRRPMTTEGAPSSDQAQATTGGPEQATAGGPEQATTPSATPAGPEAAATPKPIAMGPKEAAAPSPIAAGPQEDASHSDDNQAMDPEEQDLARRIRAALERVGQGEHADREEPTDSVKSTDQPVPLAPAPSVDANQPPAEGPPRSTSESDAADSSGTAIPQLDLAEQILAEQRRMVAQRRQRSRPAGTSAAGDRGIRHVVQRIAGEAPRRDAGGTGEAGSADRPPTQARSGAISPPARPALQRGGDSQIARIVAADIARLYRQTS